MSLASLGDVIFLESYFDSRFTPICCTVDLTKPCSSSLLSHHTLLFEPCSVLLSPFNAVTYNWNSRPGLKFNLKIRKPYQKCSLPDSYAIMANPELIRVLESTASGDLNLLSQASQYLEIAAQNDFPSLVTNLSYVLKDVNQSSFSRLQAAIQLKNQVSSKVDDVRRLYITRWLSLPADTRNSIKSNCLDALGTEQCRPSQAAQCVGCIACFELPDGQWLEVIDDLVKKVVEDNSPVTVREASLEAIGYICHDLSLDFLYKKSNEILTAIVFGMMADQNADSLKLAATNALLNSLDFTCKNFEIEAERNYIMQVVCEATQSTNTAVCMTALQVLVKIVTLYYQYMATYMEQALFTISIDAIHSSKVEIALQGIEFWSTICDVELDIMSDIEQAKILNDATISTRPLLNFASSACSYLVPDLLDILKQQDENDDEDEWNPCKAAGVCLMSMSEVSGDQIIEPVMTFVNNNINSPDWRCRDSAVMAFGSILVDPPGENLIALAEQAPLALLPMMNDSSIIVRDTVAWALGRLCDNLPDVCLSDKFLDALLETLIKGLSDHPRVAHNVCWALSSLASSAHRDLNIHGDIESGMYKLSACFPRLIQNLLETTDRSDASQNHLRSAAYEAIVSVVRSSSKDCNLFVKELYVGMLNRLEHVLDIEAKGMNQSDRSDWCEIQAMLCATLQAAIQKLDISACEDTSDRIISALMRVISCSHNSTSGATEDAIGTLSLLLGMMDNHFAKYIKALMPYIIDGIKNYACKQAFVVYTGFFGDICRKIENLPTVFCDNVMEVILLCLNDSALEKELRPQILTLIGDIATVDAATANIDVTTDPEIMDYFHSLHESCLDALTGIVQGLENTGQNEISVALNYTDFMFHFIIFSTKDSQCPESILHAAIGLLGDIVKTFGITVRDQVKTKKVNDLLLRGRQSSMMKTKKLANWASNEVHRRLASVN
ncbi:hypothetical protein GJ496_007121 [Pomphorhynchus laevis]|nr:hypothetical protein GJ496_007121 [Pomphorhynchus laevis]